MRKFVFNNQSLTSVFADYASAADAFVAITKGAKVLIECNIATPVLDAQIAMSLNVTSEKTFHDVLINMMRTPEYKQYAQLLLTIATKEFRIEDGISDKLHLCDADNNEFKICYLTNSIALSLPTATEWSSDTISFVLESLTAQEEDIIETSVEIDNISCPQHGNNIKQRHYQNYRESITRENFWEKKWVYENLSFGLDVRTQLESINPTDFKTVLQKLANLNQDCANWIQTETVYPVYSIPVSNESQSTMQQFGESRVFRNPSGERTTYEPHAKLGNIRIHFALVFDKKIIEIGYIGKHLSTTSCSN